MTVLFIWLNLTAEYTMYSMLWLIEVGLLFTIYGRIVYKLDINNILLVNNTICMYNWAEICRQVT